MRRSFSLRWLAALLALAVMLGEAQARKFNSKQLQQLIQRLTQIDFEALPHDERSCDTVGTTLVNPLMISGLIITDPFCLETGFCSSPSCESDPDNAHGGNNAVFLNPGGTIEFTTVPKLAVLDIQGIGDSPFTLRITDGHGDTFEVDAQGVSFKKSLVPLFSPYGIKTIEVGEVGAGGPLSVAAVYVE